MAKNAQIYVNTMVFSIVAGLLSIALLVALVFVQSLNAYIYAIATIEVGLLAIIILSLYSIMAYESKVRKALTNAGKNSIAANSCPDYYTMRFSENGPTNNTCRNFFSGKMPSGSRYVMYYVPSGTYTSVTGPKQGVVFSGNPADGNIKIKSLETMTMTDACKVIQGLPQESDVEKTTANNYTIPWTDLRPKCENIVYS